jgi:hypothetical protein
MQRFLLIVEKSPNMILTSKQASNACLIHTFACVDSTDPFANMQAFLCCAIP